ncbi:MAG TPA: XdhC/CoxI family protein [Thermoanaerobaculia bacterium]|jgi:xanthine dehydrogenase accessory factor|nr:XdhC/CoxI family protein [Thermoanaerobaculia bacterium]
MAVARIEEVLAEAERSLKGWGRLALCQIVRAEGSTPGKIGWKLIVRPDGTSAGNLGGGAFEGLVRSDAAAKLASGSDSEIKRYYFTEEAVKGEPTGMVCGGMAEVFLEVLHAAPLLVICGGGPVGQALARAAVLAGFDLLVTDDREEFRRPELFPAGSEIASVDRDYAGDFLAPFSRRDLFVAIVSRCWETDTAALAAVLRAAPPHLRYLGLMGSRRKIQRVRAEVAARGHDLSRVALRAPIGLPIGGDSPGEIAISILAEMIRDRYDSPDSTPATGTTQRREAVEQECLT